MGRADLTVGAARTFFRKASIWNLTHYEDALRKPPRHGIIAPIVLKGEDMANDAFAQKAQNCTNRGRQALEAGRFELAVELLSQALEYAPDLLETRKLLRAA